jgi:signal transduction histidine kinase
MPGRLFESRGSVRPDGVAEPHLGLGLYMVRLIAEFHGGKARAANREDGSGVVMRVDCPAQ